MKKLKFNHMLAMVSTMAMVAGSHSVYAQQASQEAEEILVTGFKASLEKAQELKKENTSIVEAVVAEDIGKLPDSSIAETLARLPGLAGERVNGRTSGLSVRGFKEDFVGTTLNGRELLGIGDNRGVEYDLYPAEILSGAVVYKTPDATLSTTGIGGTVDLRTVRPLAAKPTIAVNATFEKNSLDKVNPDYDNQGHRYALSYSNKFADDTVGVALAAATTSSPTQEQRTGVWGYSKSADAGGAYAPSGIQTYAVSNILKRDAVSGVLEFKPNEQLDITLDALHINFKQEGILRGFEGALPIDTSKPITIENGVVTAASTLGFKSVLREDPRNLEGKLDTFGANAAYKVDDNLTLKLDVAHSKSSKDEFRAEAYAGVGRAGLPTQGAETTRNYTLGGDGLVYSNNSTDFSDYNMVKLAGPQAWGGSLAPVAAFQPTAAYPNVGPAQAQDGFVNEAIFDEKLDTFRLEGTEKFDNSFITAVTVGAQYSKRSKSKVNSGAFATAPTWPSDGPVPTQYRRGITDLSFAGLGKVVAFDALSLFKNGYYTLTDAARLETQRLGDTYTVDEKVLTGFVKADYETTLSDKKLSGNFGLQAVNTDQSSDGYVAVTGADQFVKDTSVSGGAQYNKYLPSLNANYDLSDSQKIRFALAKSISRARFDYLKASSYVYFNNNLSNVTNPNPVQGPWTSTAGNPELRPLEANSADLNYEWYFADDGYVSVGTYYKDLLNWQRQGSAIVDFTPYYIPGYHQAVDTNNKVFTPATFKGVSTFEQDGLHGKVDGLEAAANVPFRVFADALDGLGVLASASWNYGHLNDPVDPAIPGLSKKVSQLTVYYEHAGFEVRVAGTRRDSFESVDRGGSNSLVPVTRQPVQHLVDAQISYDFADSGIESLKGLRISLQGQNLTKEKDINTDPADSRLITKASEYGADYLLNFNYKY